jgi:hypothetical protein
MRTLTKTLTQTLTLALLAAAPGCIHAAADVDADENVSFDLGDLGTTCDGTGEARTDSSVTTWAKTAVGDRCQIDVVWNGTLIDMKMVREKADAQAQGAQLTIQAIDLGFDDIGLRDQNGANITPPRVPGWDAHLTLQDTALADFSGTDVAALLAAPTSFDMPGNTITLANQAFAASVPLTGAGTARLLVEMADVAALGAAAGPHIQFHFKAHVTADAKKDLL